MTYQLRLYSWHCVFTSTLLLVLGLAAIAGAQPKRSGASFGHVQSGDYFNVAGPCCFEFPRDHGVHPGYRTEWWYYTGNLRALSGEPFGFQLTFFRAQMSPPGAEKGWPPKPSAWRTQQLFLAHAALSDLGGGIFTYDEQMARGAVGLAGVSQEGKITRVFLGTWSAHLGPERHRLKARTDRFVWDLFLIPLKPPIAHGLEGYSLKGKKPESASCYYSLTRLETSGTLGYKGETFQLQGEAWMDHEFSTASLEADLSGWEWFSIQLANNTELMIYLLRYRMGGYSPASSGTFVQDSGKKLHLSWGDFSVDILDHWHSPHTGALYPSRWRIHVHPLQLSLLVVPNLADQELSTPKTTQINYWEGSVSVTGRFSDLALDGVGYVEMTGYDEPFNRLR